MYAVFSDAHLGKPGFEPGLAPLHEALARERASGRRIVWLGDTLDLWHNHQAIPPDGLVRPEDIWIPGNHDWGYLPPHLETRRYLDLGWAWLGHGDEVDFHYAFALMEQGTWPPLVGCLRRWKRGHVERLYQAIEALPDWAIARLERGRLDERALLIALALLLPSLIASDPRLYPSPVGAIGSSIGIVTTDPHELVRRYTLLVPESAGKHLVIGHLHTPRLTLVGKQALLVLGAWGPDATQWVYGRVGEGRLELVAHDGTTLSAFSTLPNTRYT